MKLNTQTYLLVGVLAVGGYFYYQNRTDLAAARRRIQNLNKDDAGGSSLLDDVNSWIPGGSNLLNPAPPSTGVTPSDAPPPPPAGLGAVVAGYIAVYDPKIRAGRGAPPPLPAPRTPVPGLRWIKVRGSARRPAKVAPNAIRRVVCTAAPPSRRVCYFRWTPARA